MRISDWSSDVYSSDLIDAHHPRVKLREQAGVQQCTVHRARRPVDFETGAEGIKGGTRARESPTRIIQGVANLVRERGTSGRLPLRVPAADIELRIVNDEGRVCDELQDGVRFLGDFGLSFKDFVRKPVNAMPRLGHPAFRLQALLEHDPGLPPVAPLTAPDSD